MLSLLSLVLKKIEEKKKGRGEDSAVFGSECLSYVQNVCCHFS